MNQLEKTYKGPYKSISKKDLKNLSHYLSKRVDKKLKEGTNNKKKSKSDLETQSIFSILEKTTSHLVKNTIPICYKYHLSGVAHKKGIGPGRTPIKAYKYFEEVLKNLRGEQKNLKSAKKVMIGIETSSAKRMGGYRRAGRGSVNVEDRRVHRITLKFKDVEEK